MEVMVQNQRLPAKAGKAEIYFDGSTSTPAREKEFIRLPLHPEAMFHPLLRGQQFLFAVPVVTGDHWNRRTETAIYFGGTDEEPFLVRLNPEVFKSFQTGGEKGFFAALKPQLVSRFESIFNKSAKRQGDIFAVRTPYSWKTLKTIRLMLNEEDEPQKVEPVEAKAESVFRTRHRFTGFALRVELSYSAKPAFVEGLLEAPDHAPLTLDGLHVLAQTTNLFDPRNAD